MQNVSSQFKYTIDLGVSATKTIFKLKKSSKDKASHILLIVFMFIMSVVLFWDIIRGASIVIDLIILIALVAVEILSLFMPLIIIAIQKRFLRKLNLEEMDYTITEISKNKCTETYYKDGEIQLQNVCDVRKILCYTIDKKYAYVVFNNFACAVFDVDTLNVSIEEFKQTLDNIISKNKSSKFVR